MSALLFIIFFAFYSCLFHRGSGRCESVDDLLSIPATVTAVDFHSLGSVQLRTLGSLYQIKGAARWTRQQAIAALTV